MSKLILQNAGFKYGSTVVLRSINLETEPGEFIGILGPNGSGKSTLLKGLVNIIPACTGSVLLNEENIRQCKQSHIAKKIAFVPQYAILPDLFTATDIVLMGRTPHLGLLSFESSKDLSIVASAMEITQTTHLAHKRVSQLSGGERQRIVIARALAQEARILLLDEPTANLDINFQAEILNFLRNLCHVDKLTVIAVVHDLNLASQYCDRILMLKGGSIFKQGKPENVIDEQSIKEVYGVDIRVFKHPVNGLPTALVTPPDKNGNGSSH